MLVQYKTLTQEEIKQKLAVQQKKNDILTDQQKVLYEQYQQTFQSNKKEHEIYKQQQIVSNFSVALKKTLFKSDTQLNSQHSIFFKIGRNPIYSEFIFVFAFRDLEDPNTTYWSPLDNCNDIQVKNNLRIPPDVSCLLQNEILQISKQLGRFIIYKNTWGFLLDLVSSSDIYGGNLSDFWPEVLKQAYFQDIFRRFAYYQLDEKDEDGDGQEDLKLRDIKGTQDDAYIHFEHICFWNNMFHHQKTESGWMFKLEVNPYITFPNDSNSIPLLDSGFYFDPQNPQKLLKKKQLQNVSYEMKGGILASEIGSGKTLSMIALSMMGKLLDDKKMFKQIQKAAELQQEEKEENPEFIKQDNYIQDLIDIQVYLPSLVIVTKNILFQWGEEYQKFAPMLRIRVIDNVKEFSNLKLTTKMCILESEYGVLKDYDIIITNRETILSYFLQQQNNVSHEPIFRVNFARIILDEFHEITNIYNNRQNKNAQVSKENQFLATNIEKFYKYINLLQFNSKFTWGVTGTVENLNYADQTEGVGIILNLDKDYYEVNYYDRLKDAFVQNSIRSNPRSVTIPPLQKQVQKVYFGQIQKLLYKGKIHYEDESQSRQLCSYFTNQFDFLFDGNYNDQFDTAMVKVQNMFIQELQTFQNQIELEQNPTKKQQLQARLTNMTNESNFYKDIIEMLSKHKYQFEVGRVDQSIYVNFNEVTMNAQSNKFRIAPMFPYLQKNKKYEFQFLISQFSGQENSIGLGIVPQKREKYENKFSLETDAEEQEVQMITNLNDIKLFQNDLINMKVNLIDKQISFERQKIINNNIKTDQLSILKIKQSDSFTPAVFLKNHGDQVQCINQESVFECPLCLEDFSKQNMVVTECLHQICRNCYDLLIKNVNIQCPICKQDIDDKQILIHPRYENQIKKSKIDVLIEQIQITPVEDKIIIFTQFSDLTTKISQQFDVIGLQYTILLGEPSEINIRLNIFKKLPEVKVLIMSVEQAASGINVTEANHVFFVHPIFMNREKAMSTYLQCIGRCYRVGQEKEVFTKLFITCDSIEEENVRSFDDINFSQ